MPNSNHSKNRNCTRHVPIARSCRELILTIAFALAVSAASGPAAADCTAHGSAHRVALLELYTSEGCNSCPPADRWLSRLTSLGFDSTRVVALAFHVDYWNALGWRDRFSAPGFAARQRAAASRNGMKFLYTPQFLLNGRDVRPLFDLAPLEKEVTATNRLPSSLRLSLLQRRNDNVLTVSIDAQRWQGPLLELYVAVTEDGLETEVHAGENKGKLLRHDAVVRELKGPIAWSGSNPLRAELKIAIDRDWRESSLDVVAFFQDPGSGEVVQTIKSGLCRV